MCGICGAVWTDEKYNITSTVLDAMTDSMQHRGPDDRGTFLQPLDEDNPAGVALGHRRLSILDLSPAGHQPLFNEDGSVVLVFNGEIYNFTELKKQLLARGHIFRGHSDSEVLVHLYEEKQEKMLQELNGMFAFAVWDKKRQQIFIARDRIGKKPLYYFYGTDRGIDSGTNRLVFGSELKSILAVRDIPREPDNTAIDDYLTYQYIPHPKTIYKNICKLPPAHYLILDLRSPLKAGRNLSVKRYWNPDSPEDASRSESDWQEELRSLIYDAVKIRLQSDVPVGAFLSGGIDSSITATLMQEIVKKESGNPIRTFCIGFDFKEYDESKFAENTARLLGTQHKTFIMSPLSENEFDNVLNDIIHYYDEPFADSSAIPTLQLCKMTRNEVAAALSGDGGDEMFAGYDRYRAVQLGQCAEILPLFLRKTLASVSHILPSPTAQRNPFRRFKRFLEALGMSGLEQYLQFIAVFNNERRKHLYTDKFYSSLQGNNPLDFLQQYLIRAENVKSPLTNFLNQILSIDRQTYLPCDLMTKVDIASMAHSLEVRAPLLDYRIAELAAKMPLSLKRGGIKGLGKKGKLILRRTFRKELEPLGIESRPKTGFGVPLDRWFRGTLKNYVRNLLLDSMLIRNNICRKEYIDRLLTEHISSRFNHSQRLWALLVLEKFLEKNNELRMEI